MNEMKQMSDCCCVHLQGQMVLKLVPGFPSQDVAVSAEASLRKEGGLKWPSSQEKDSALKPGKVGGDPWIRRLKSIIKTLN